jgi:succinate dehydrogenase/fumarate reductase flavoprotein subunit
MIKEQKAKKWLPENWNREADVVVVGYGGAGAVTAITAFDAGAKVIILEKSPSIASLNIGNSKTGFTTNISGGGGNTHIAVGDAVSPTNAADAAKYLYSACGGQTPMDVCLAWAEEVCKNAAWFEKMGINGAFRQNRPTEYPFLPGASAMTVFGIMGWGPKFFARLDKHVQERGIEVLFSTPGKELIQDYETREIVGVKAENQGKTLYIKASRGVVLCTGGFEFNEEMKNRFLKCWPMKFYGWGYNTGDGIKMAQKVGADLWHMDVLAGGNCSWFNDPQYDFGMSTRTRTANYIWVNKFGKRYCNEPAAWNPHGGWVIHLERNDKYPGFSRIPSYIVFDETARLAGSIGADEAVKGGMPVGRILLPKELGGFEGWSQDNINEIERGWIKKGDTVEDLAASIGGEMDAVALKATIETYNGFCTARNDREFGRDPEKLLPVAKPPYYAVPLYPGLVSTCGGPVRSVRAEVLDPDGNPIPRLYSAGSCGSVYGGTYSVTGGNLGELSAFGRIAGRNVAALSEWA